MFGKRLPDDVVLKFLLSGLSFEDICRLEIADSQVQSVLLTESDLWFECGLRDLKGFRFGPELSSAPSAEIKKLFACLRQVSVSEVMWSWWIARIEGIDSQAPRCIEILDRKAAADIVGAVVAAKEYSSSGGMNGHVQLVLASVPWGHLDDDLSDPGNYLEFDEFLDDMGMPYFAEDPEYDTDGSRRPVPLWRVREQEEDEEKEEDHYYPDHYAQFDELLGDGGMPYFAEDPEYDTDGSRRIAPLWSIREMEKKDVADEEKEKEEDEQEAEEQKEQKQEQNEEEEEHKEEEGDADEEALTACSEEDEWKTFDEYLQSAWSTEYDLLLQQEQQELSRRPPAVFHPDDTASPFHQSEYVKFLWKGVSVQAALGFREKSTQQGDLARKLQVIVDDDESHYYWHQNIDVSIFGVGRDSVQARAVSASFGGRRGEQQVDEFCSDPRISPSGFLCVLCLRDVPGRMRAMPSKISGESISEKSLISVQDAGSLPNLVVGSSTLAALNLEPVRAMKA